MSNGFGYPRNEYGQITVVEGRSYSNQITTYCFNDMNDLVEQCMNKASTYQLINHLTTRLTHATESELNQWSDILATEISRRMADRLKKSAI